MCQPTAQTSERFSYEGVVNRLQLAWKQSLLPMLGFGWWFLVASTSVLWWCIKHWQLVGFFWMVLPLVIDVPSLLSIIPWLIRSVVWPAPPPSVVVEVTPDWVPLLGLFAAVMTVVNLFLILKPSKVIRLCEHGFQVEKMVEGSNIRPSPAPEFVGVVFVLRDGVKRRNGTFFRVGNYLYTAMHVVKSADKVFFVYRGMEREVTQAPVMVDVDIARYSYAPFSDWQMGAGKFAKLSQATYCEIHNGDSESMGCVTPSALGFVDYSGSTLGGFSGAPYYGHKTIYGMHIGAGAVNMGYDGAYMAALERFHPESSEGWTTDLEELQRIMVRDGEDMDMKYASNDYVLVKVGKRYVPYSEDEFEKVKKAVMQRSKRYTPESNLDCTYQDVEVIPSGNGQGPAAAVIQRAGPSKSPVHQDAQLEKLVDQVSTALTRLHRLESRITSGPPSTPAQPRKVSLSTFQSMPELTEAWRSSNLPVHTKGTLKGYPNVTEMKWEAYCAAMTSYNSSKPASEKSSQPGQ